MYIHKLTIKSTVLILLTIFIGCSNRELKDPAEFRSYEPNVPDSLEPQGYMDWEWGVQPDSIYWIDYRGKTGMVDFFEDNPSLMIKRKSGNERYSLTLLPEIYKTEYGTYFNTLHLIFHPRKGLFSWERTIDDRLANLDSSGVPLDSVYNLLTDSMAERYGMPHVLGAKNLDEDIFRENLYLWKSSTVTISLAHYRYPNEREKIVQVVKKH